MPASANSLITTSPISGSTVTTAFIDPFREAKTLAMNFSIRDPFTNEPYSRDPRNVAAKAEAFLKASGIADTVYFGPEAEFYIFDEVRFDNQPQGSFFKIDSIEAAWNTGREEEGGNLGYKTGLSVASLYIFICL